MNWQYGVTDTSFLDTQLDCLLAKSVMNQWSKTDPEKDKLLNQISCGDGKTGAECWNTETYKGVFGPIPDGNPLPGTTPDTNGNCIWTNQGSGAKVNIGPVEPKSSQYSGQCRHNIFYCNGNGLCKNKSKGTGKECVCSQGYSPDQDTNNCKISNECPFDPTAKEYGCASDITLGNEDRSKYVNYRLGECNGSSCTCYDPKDNENTKIGAWENIDGNAGYQQIGVDITSSVAKVVNTIPKCSICALDYQDNPQVYYYTNYPNLNKNTCSNQKNFGCCSGNCMEVEDNNGKGLICGECVCDKHCDSDQFCDNGVCKSRKGGVSGYSGQCAVGGTATFFDSAHCCHGTGVFTCPDNNINCPDSLPFVTD